MGGASKQCDVQRQLCCWRRRSLCLSFQDRLATLKAVREAGVSVCAGGIIGLGEGEKDRVGLIHQVRPGSERKTAQQCCMQHGVALQLANRHW